MSRKNQNDEAGKEKHVILSIEHYIPFLITTIKHTRMYPSEFWMIKKLLLSGLVVFIVAVISMNIIAEVTLLSIGVDADIFADVIGVLIQQIVGLLKWCYCTINNSKLFNIVMKLNECHTLCQRIDSTEEGCKLYKKEIEAAQRHSNILFCWSMSNFNLIVFVWTLFPLLLGTYKTYSMNDTVIDKNLPYIAWFPPNTDNNYYFFIKYFIQTFGTFSCAVGISCYDSFYMIMLIIVCAQFRHINRILAKTDFIENTRTSEAVRILKRRLEHCVDYHVEIIKFLEKLQLFTGPIMFVQCIATLFVICLISFEAAAVNLTIDKENSFTLFKLVGYSIATALELGCFCYYATQITHLASQIPNGVYSCGWEILIFEREESSSIKKRFKYDTDLDRLVRTIIIQAQRPIIMTGGPFYVLSMETFRAVRHLPISSIISMAISNSIMLRQLSDTSE